MGFKIEGVEEIITVVAEEGGKSLAALASDIQLGALSLVVDYGEHAFTPSDIDMLKKWDERIKDYKGLLVLTGSKNPEIEHVLYLPTFHEAKEAIFMNDLENQFLEEMGE